jgi:hypothetical protein
MRPRILLLFALLFFLAGLGAHLWEISTAVERSCLTLAVICAVLGIARPSLFASDDSEMKRRFDEGV